MSFHRPEFKGLVMLCDEYNQQPVPGARRLDTHYILKPDTLALHPLSPSLPLSLPSGRHVWDSLCILCNPLSAWSENREWDNANHPTSGSQCVPWTSSSSTWELVGNANPRSPPRPAEWEAEGGANDLHKPC